jgi:N-acetylglucosaminyl-diphospho-decaprenol L-rhamnosyltransferase
VLAFSFSLTKFCLDIIDFKRKLWLKDGVRAQAELAVIVVNFRTPDFVIQCVSSLLPELEQIDAKILVVDNHSADDSVDRIETWLLGNDLQQKVLFIRSETNSGFSGGNNAGILAVESNYYLLLNSDTLVRPGSVSTLLEAARRSPSAGIISPRLEWPDEVGQESCFRFHSPVSEFLRAAQTGIIDRCFDRFIVPLPVQSECAWPDWTSFACVLIKREVFQKVGLLDQGFFMYFEDAEYCHRTQKAGWKVLHIPNARVVHLRGGSSPVKEQTRLKRRLPRYYYESRTRYFYLLYGRLGMTAANLLWWLGRSISLTRQWLGRSDKLAVERQWLDIWVNWLDPMGPYTHPEAENVAE